MRSVLHNHLEQIGPFSFWRGIIIRIEQTVFLHELQEALRSERRLRIHERQHGRRTLATEQLNGSGMKRMLVENKLGGKEAQKLGAKGSSLIVVHKLSQIEVSEHYKERTQRRVPVSTMHRPITTALFFPP